MTIEIERVFLCPLFFLKSKEMKITCLIILTILSSAIYSRAQCSTPSIIASNIDCSSISSSDIITGGAVNFGETKYLTTSPNSNISVGTGGVLIVCGNANLSIGSGVNLLSLNGGALVISSCADVTLNSGGSPTYINSGSEIINYGLLNISQLGSFIQIDNGAKLFNFASLNIGGTVFLKNGEIINDNQGNTSFIEVLTQRMGSGGSTQYASSNSKVCLAENSCLTNNVLVNGINSNWIEYGGGSVNASLNGTFNITGNPVALSNDSEINVCTSDNDFRWGSTNYTVVPNVSSCLACSVIDPCNVALPVEMGDFEAAILEGEVHLNWRTISELNNESFEIERFSFNQWESIGSIAGQGTSPVANSYFYIDSKPYQGVNYYRLKQFDTDGRFTYSKSISVNIDTEIVRISPNPSNGIINISLPRRIKNAKIQVLDMQGRIIHEINSNQQSEIQIELNNNSGLYYLNVIASEYKSSHKIVLK